MMLEEHQSRSESTGRDVETGGTSVSVNNKSPSPPNSSIATEVTRTANDGDIHVVTENGEQCFMWRSKQLTYIAQDRQELPQILATKFGHLATKLDLSYNTLTSFRNINLFTNLSELILDNNSLVDEQLDFRQNLRLKTLSLNKNKLRDLYRLISSVKLCFPNLEFLSLLGNPLCPSVVVPPDTNSQMTKESEETSESQLNSIESYGDFTVRCIHSDQQTEYKYEKYRLFIIYHLPNLRFLDSSPVHGHERDLALKRCYWMNRSPVAQQQPLASNNNQERELLLRANELPFENQAGNLGDERSTYNGVGVQTEPQTANNFQMTIMSDYVDNVNGLANLEVSNGQMASSMPAAGHLDDQHKGAFARLAYKYTGRNSEGNRFIRNHDL